GQDSTALRQRLLIRPENLPYTTALGRRIDSGSHRQAFEQAVVWAHDVRQRRAADARGSIGIGFASYIEGIAPNYALTSGLWPAYESCTVRIDPDGKVVVAGGVCPTGQGLETMMAGVTSRALGVPSDDVVVRLGDTDLTPYGLGSFGSRSTVVASGAILRAGDRLRTKVIEIAAGLLEADGADLVMADGQVHVRGSQTSSVSLADIAAVAYFRTDRLPPGVEPGLEASAAYDPPGIDFRPDADGKMNICVTYTNSTHAAVVDVDRSTGQVTLLDYLAVHDAGPLLHPQLADGQVRGGLAQGIGGALYEELTYSPDGQPLVTSFMDYLLPGAGEVPDLTVEH
ncbi:MAG: molybdopterin cofactor-binding domain-containing protein, partial [Candidatus Limnocylindrales bacterium]